MVKSRKKWGQLTLTLLLSLFGISHCYGISGTVSVSVSPSHQTVKTRADGATEQIGVNTAQYTVTASCDPKADANEEVKALEPSWTLSRTALFIPPVGVTPVPTDPGTLMTTNHTASSSTASWAVKAHSKNAGEWRITFTAKVVYKLKNSVTDAYIYENGSIKTVEFTGTGSCTFKATGGKFKIVLLFDDNFAGRSQTRMGVGEGATITVVAIDPVGGTATIDTDADGKLRTSGAGSITVSGTRVTAGDSSGSGTITVWAKVNGGTATMETLGVTVVEPTGVTFEEIVALRNTRNGAAIGIGFRGAGFVAKAYLLPTDVSFNGLTIAEEGVGGALNLTVKANRDGSLKDMTPELHPAWSRAAGPGNISKGCYVLDDNVNFAWYNYPGNGKFIWDIPWTYKTSSMLKPKVFATLIHNCQNIGDKRSTISKNGITVERTIP